MNRYISTFTASPIQVDAQLKLEKRVFHQATRTRVLLLLFFICPENLTENATMSKINGLFRSSEQLIYPQRW
jgi:hypothetical protein